MSAEDLRRVEILTEVLVGQGGGGALIHCGNNWPTSSKSDTLSRAISEGFDAPGNEGRHETIRAHT